MTRHAPRRGDARDRVSVVVPCYNYGRYLRGAVASALQPQDVDVDVVVVDDASTDDSGAIADELAARDPRVRVVHHGVNLGHIATANEALSLATGRYVVKLDADDLLTPGSLARSAALLSAHPGVAFCYGRVDDFEGAPPAVDPAPARAWTVWRGDRWTERVLRRGHNVIRQPEVMIRRDALEAAGGYRPQLPWAEDLNLWLRLAAVGDVGRVAGPTQGLYRLHDASLMRSAGDLELTDLRWRLAAVELFLAEHPGPPADVARLRRIGLSALAREARILAARVADRGGDPAVAAGIAHELEARDGVRRARTPAAARGPVGRAARGVADRVRWRRWRRTGL